MNAKEWNDIHPVGTRVHYYPFASGLPDTPDEHNRLHYDTRTTSKAFDTPHGPAVRIALYGMTVHLDRLVPVSPPPHPVQFRPSRAAGFTLMELVIVVAVVGILAAMAIPNFSRWIDRERMRKDVGELVETVKRERIAATSTGGASIVLDPWGYTVTRRGGSPIAHPWPPRITAEHNIIGPPLIRLDSYGRADFETPVTGDAEPAMEPVWIDFTGYGMTLRVEITAGGQRMMREGRK